MHESEMWAVVLLSGIANGVVRGAIRDASHILFDWRLLAMAAVSTPSSVWTAFAPFVGIALGYGVIAVVLVLIEPLTAGTGTADVAAALNGVKTPRFFSLRTASIKFFATLFTSASGLIWVGPESSMSHLGGATNLLVAKGWLLCRGNWSSRNETRFSEEPTREAVDSGWNLKAKLTDRERLDLIASGLAMGTAAAFRVTVSGLVFVAEGLAPLWRYPLFWRTLCGSFLSVYIARLIDDYFKCSSDSNSVLCVDARGFIAYPTSGGVLLSGLDYLAIVITSVVCGIAGGATSLAVQGVGGWFVSVFSIRHEGRRFAFALTGIALTCLIITGLIAATDCLPSDGIDLPHTVAISESLFCPSGQHNPAGVILLSYHETSIRYVYDATITMPYWLIVLIWLFVSVFAIPFTFAPLPVGFFTPNLLTGALVGRFFGQALGSSNPEAVAVAGSAAALVAYLRFPMSSAMLVLQMTTEMRLLIPVLIAVVVSYSTAYQFSPSLQEIAIRIRGIPYLPFLHAKVRNCLARKTIGEAFRASGNEDGHELVSSVSESTLINGIRLVSDVACFKEIEEISIVRATLLNTCHNGFPIIGDDCKVIGLVRRDVVDQILDRLSSSDSNAGPLTGSITFPIDQSTAAFIVESDHPFLRCYRLFSRSGLRHMVVVDPDTKKIEGIVTRADLVEIIHSVPEPHHYYLTI